MRTIGALSIAPAIAGVLSVLALTAEPAPKDAPAATFRLQGAVEKEGDWSAATLKERFPETFRERGLTFKGAVLQARSLPLLELVQSAVPRRDPAAKNSLLAFAVVVKAKDGYCVAFSLGELLPEHGKREVYLVTEVGGAPLPEKESPARLIVLDDEKASRSLYAIASITVLNLSRSPEGSQPPRNP